MTIREVASWYLVLSLALMPVSPVAFALTVTMVPDTEASVALGAGEAHCHNHHSDEGAPETSTNQTVDKTRCDNFLECLNMPDCHSCQVVSSLHSAMASEEDMVSPPDRDYLIDMQSQHERLNLPPDHPPPIL